MRVKTRRELKVNLELSLLEFEIIMLWASQASDTSWFDEPTRKPMIEFAERLRYEARVLQLPKSVVMPKIEGNFK